MLSQALPIAKGLHFSGEDGDDIPWTPDGLDELSKIPGFVRGKIKKKTETYAREQGIEAGPFRLSRILWRELRRCQGMGVVSNNWSESCFAVNLSHAQTLMLTDAQPPSLGPP